jgi:DNA-binding response OmpR family regulator
MRKISDIPIIMLTAKKSEIDRLKGFDFGADDYVIKPFSPKELIKRVDVLIRRVYSDDHKEDKKIIYNQLTLDLKNQILYKNNQPIEITSSEFKLLKTFFNNKGQVLSRDQLIERSFGYDYEGFDRTIDTHIKRIRKKIEEDHKNPIYIKTKYGAGYIFGGEDTHDDN